MGNPLMLILAVLVLLLGAGGALLYMANTMDPPREQREVVIPDDQLPD